MSADDRSTDPGAWERRNNEHLSDALQWLRQRLMALAAEQHPPAPLQPVLEPPRRRSLRPRIFHPGAGRRPVPDAEPATPALRPGPTPEPSALETPPAMVGERPPALVELAARVGLSSFERDVLLLAVAPELDPQLAAVCGLAQGDPALAFPTFALAMRALDAPVWEALAPDRPLRRLQLVTLDPGGIVTAALRADERIVNYVKGLDHVDERLRRLMTPMATSDGKVAPSQSQLEVVESIMRRVSRAGVRSLVIDLVGADSSSKRLLAQRVAADLGRWVLRLPVSNLPPPGTDLDVVLRLWERDSLLSPFALYLDASDEASDGGPDVVTTAGRMLAGARGLVFLDSREVWPRLEPSALVVDVAGPTVAEQRTQWVAGLGPGSEAIAADLASQFDLDLVTLSSLAEAEGTGDGTPEQRRRRVWRAALASTRPRLDLLAQRVEPRATSGDLIVPSDVGDQIERIKAQVQHRATVHTDWGLAETTSRGLGISALFAGESGTGKTLAAEVLAAELDLNLYRIDLSAVVSKYIGETEKNLRRLFDAAERGGTILFFDEADALFGKRSEVRDSHDRYANIEVNYLLQRMETYDGLAILATNMKGALDQAFKRRLRFVVDFPFPGPEQRQRIWHRAFVPKVRTDQLDHARLACLTLTGGSIHNVAVNATFEAAAGPVPAVTMPAVLAAARLEYRKLGRPINEADFSWSEPEPLPQAVLEPASAVQVTA